MQVGGQLGSFRHQRAGTGAEDKTVVLPEDGAWRLGRLEPPAGCAEGYRGTGLSPRSEAPPRRGEVAGTPAWRSQSAGEPTRPTQAGWALAPHGILSRWEAPVSGPPQPASLAEPRPKPGPDSKPRVSHSLRVPGAGGVWALPGPQVQRGLGSLAQ